MKKYVAIYMTPSAALEEMQKNTNPEQMKAMLESWKQWIASHQASLVDVGAPLGKTMRVNKEGVTTAKNEINGYSVVQAESHEEAAKIFLDNPQIQGMPGAYVDVLEWIDMQM